MISHVAIQTLKPFDINPAYAVNMLCCIFGAITCYFISKIVDAYHSTQNKSSDDDGSSALSAISGVLFALSPLTWEYSTGTEVFALNNLVIAIILYNTLQVSITSSKNVLRHCRIGAFFCGIALTNQHTSLLFEIVLIPYVCYILKIKGLLHLRTIATLFVAFSTGILPYLYLIWASHFNPIPGSWGDMSTWMGFIRHITRSEYGSMKLAPARDGVEGSIDRWYAYMLDIVDQFHHFGMVFAFIGIAFCINKEIINQRIVDENKMNDYDKSSEGEEGSKMQKSVESKKVSEDSYRPTNLFSIAIFITFTFYLAIWNGIFSNLPLSIPMPRAVHSRFWMQPNIIVCIFMGQGLHVTFNKLFKSVGRKKILSYALLCMVLIICMMKQQKMHGRQHSGMIMQRYSEALLSSIPENSLLLAHTDLNWNTVRYLQSCENSQKNITHINFQLLPYPWFQRQIKNGFYPNVIFPKILRGVNTDPNNIGNTQLITRFLSANLKHGNNAFEGGVYIDMHSVRNADIGDHGSFFGFTLVPWGLTYRVLPNVSNFDSLSTLRVKSRTIVSKVTKIMKPFLAYDYPPGSWEFAAKSVYWDMHYQRGIFLLTFALTLAKELKQNHLLLVTYFDTVREASEELWQVYVAQKNSKSFR